MSCVLSIKELWFVWVHFELIACCFYFLPTQNYRKIIGGCVALGCMLLDVQIHYQFHSLLLITFITPICNCPIELVFWGASTLIMKWLPENLNFKIKKRSCMPLWLRSKVESIKIQEANKKDNISSYIICHERVNLISVGLIMIFRTMLAILAYLGMSA